MKNSTLHRITGSLAGAIAAVSLIAVAGMSNAATTPITGAHNATSASHRDVALYEVPQWMRQTCTARKVVNCYDTDLDAYVRAMPRSGGNVTCVFYVTHPRWDYCS